MNQLETRVERLENTVEELEDRLNCLAREADRLMDRIYDVKRDLEYDIYSIRSEIESVRREIRRGY